MPTAAWSAPLFFTAPEIEPAQAEPLYKLFSEHPIFKYTSANEDILILRLKKLNVESALHKDTLRADRQYLTQVSLLAQLELWKRGELLWQRQLGSQNTYYRPGLEIMRFGHNPLESYRQQKSGLLGLHQTSQALTQREWLKLLGQAEKALQEQIGGR